MEAFPAHPTDPQREQNRRPTVGDRRSLFEFPSPESALEVFQFQPQFKLHVLIGIVTSAVCLIIWVLMQFFVDVFPWWLAPVCFFLLSTSFHFFYIAEKPSWFQLHLVWTVVISVTLFLSWITTYDEGIWFIYPVTILILLLFFHYIWAKHQTESSVYLRLNLAFFVIINILFLFAWVQNKSTFPWFIIPLFVTALPLVIHICHFYYHNNLLILHFALFSYFNLLFFIAWELSGNKIPWFIFPTIAWAPLLIFHYYKAMRGRYLEIDSNYPARSSPYDYQYQQGGSSYQNGSDSPVQARYENGVTSSPPYQTTDSRGYSPTENRMHPQPQVVDGRDEDSSTVTFHEQKPSQTFASTYQSFA
ncbi:hypothetical protein PROFUN_02747 [Planoprotostelium fungivorum]|uniref:Uncharacterized protein n=1 Tax=Planoprotostelium fungivorum TaxID=1890364 RepID=A0A2P6NXH0_9EUKA|nr:hypothetical protein PROFUN_02747 [Planoprotostelium fungivorum]